MAFARAGFGPAVMHEGEVRAVLAAVDADGDGRATLLDFLQACAPRALAGTERLRGVDSAQGLGLGGVPSSSAD